MTSKYLFTRKKVINTKSKARFSDFAGIASENLSCVKPENSKKKKSQILELVLCLTWHKILSQAMEENINK